MSLSDITKPIFELLKLAPRFFATAALASAFLLFSEESLLKKLGVAELAGAHRTNLGLALIGSTALFVATWFPHLMQRIKRWRQKRERRRKIEERLRDLTEEEKQILRYYVVHGTRANSLRAMDGVVLALEQAGVIHQATRLGHIQFGHAFVIDDFAWRQLSLFPHLLEGSTDTYRTDAMSGPW